jgi:hypothetical protein
MPNKKPGQKPAIVTGGGSARAGVGDHGTGHKVTDRHSSATQG